jgi:hypothetical protein
MDHDEFAQTLLGKRLRRGRELDADDGKLVSRGTGGRQRDHERRHQSRPSGNSRQHNEL